jgi:transposase
MTNTIYSKPNPKLRQLFDKAGDPKQVLCIPIDYAKSHHMALFCNGQGDILKKAFSVENSPKGLKDLLSHLDATCRKHKLQRQHAFFGGEDVPLWAENFLYALHSQDFPVIQVNAWEAKRNRTNFQASTDALDLHGIAHCLLKCRGQLFPTLSGDYRHLRDLSRERQSLVRAATALTNRLHGYVDRLFPHFLELKHSGIEPLGPACWWVMQSDRFSAPQIAHCRAPYLIKGLERHGVTQAATVVAKLQDLARQVLSPAPQHVATWQHIVHDQAAQWHALQESIAQLDRPIALLLAQTPGAFFTSISGIGITLAAGIVSEVGDQWPPIDSLCSYAGVIPAVKQSGGKDKSAVTLGVGNRCNHYLKNYLVQAANKMGTLGPPDLKERYRQALTRESHADFILAKDLLGICKALFQEQRVYLPEALMSEDSPAQERAAYYRDLFAKLLIKWRPKAQITQAFDPKWPLGQWRQMVQDAYKISLPLSTPASLRPAADAAKPTT